MVLDRQPGVEGSTNRIKIPLYEGKDNEYYYIEYGKSESTESNNPLYDFAESYNQGASILYHAKDPDTAERGLINFGFDTGGFGNLILGLFDDLGRADLSYRLMKPNGDFSLKDGEYFYDKETGIVVRQIRRYFHDGSDMEFEPGVFHPAPARDYVYICAQKIPEQTVKHSTSTNQFIASVKAQDVLKIDGFSSANGDFYSLGCRRIEYKIPERVLVDVDAWKLQRAIDVSQEYDQTETLVSGVWEKEISCQDGYRYCDERYWEPQEDGKVKLGHDSYIKIVFRDSEAFHKAPDWEGGSMTCYYYPQNPVRSGLVDFIKRGCSTKRLSYYSYPDSIKDNFYNYNKNTAPATDIGIGGGGFFPFDKYGPSIYHRLEVLGMFQPKVELEAVRLLEGGSGSMSDSFRR